MWLQYEDAPPSFKFVVWGYFDFVVEYNAEEKKRTKKKLLCASIALCVAYSNGNTSNMTAHLQCHHPAISLSESRIAEQVIQSSKKQQSLSDSFQKRYPTGPERHKNNKGSGGVHCQLFGAVFDDYRCGLSLPYESARSALQTTVSHFFQCWGNSRPLWKDTQQYQGFKDFYWHSNTCTSGTKLNTKGLIKITHK